MTVEKIILENIINNDEFFRQVLPFLKEEYFDSRIERTIFKFIKTFADKHNKSPNSKILRLMASEFPKFTQEEFSEADILISELNGVEENKDWLIERTEKFCKDKAVYNSIMTAIQILDGKNDKFNKEAIPSILQEALAVSFDKSVGHNYLEDSDHRWEYYHLKEKKIPFAIDIMNKVTNGGVSSKTLNVYLMPTGVGKSLTMCDHAAFCIRNGYKALYITLEMAEEKIAERIDCNLLDYTPVELKRISGNVFKSAFEDIKSSAKGNLIIREYPTCGAHAGHFRLLLDELKLKQNFIPDIIFIDYINICSSQRLKMGGSVNSYAYIKSIAEELRGLAVEYDVPIISATQTNRGGANNSDIDSTDTSDSFGLPMTVDLLWGGMRTEELDKQGMILFKQLKSRYGDINYYRKFVVGVDLPHFKLYDVSESAQQDLDDGGKTDKDTPLFDKSRSKAKTDYSGIDFD